MKKLKYIEKLYALIFLSLGGTFIFMGLLCYIGIVKPSEHSVVQAPIIMGTVFSLIGVAFCIVQTVFRFINAKKNKLHNVDSVVMQKENFAGIKPTRLRLWFWQP